MVHLMSKWDVSEPQRKMSLTPLPYEQALSNGGMEKTYIFCVICLKSSQEIWQKPPSECFGKIFVTQHSKSLRFTFSWAAVGSVMICPSVLMAQVTPQKRQLMGNPASIRAIHAAFKQQDSSWGTGKEEHSQKHLNFRALLADWI